MKPKMARLLSKIIFYSLLFLFNSAICQNAEDIHRPKDYKDKKQFEKFLKKRKIVGAWQINQLRHGALVVKLKTNKILIDELRKAGNIEMAENKKLETYFINKNIMAAYRDKFTFCKVYFINSNSSDSLLRGARAGIFLDSNLTVDPAIEMKEKFYLIAEKDYVYNSSIGFVVEDSARKVIEKGNPGGEMAEAVIKNKYGHQLKKPFPYIAGYGMKSSFAEISFVKSMPMYYFENEGQITSAIDKTQLVDLKNSTNREFKKPPAGAKVFQLEKHYSYEIVALKIERLDEDVNAYYKGSPKPEMDKIDKEIISFLY